MSKRRPLCLVDGGTAQEQRATDHLRPGRPPEAPAQEPSTRNVEWRNLIRRLTKNPVKP